MAETMKCPECKAKIDHFNYEEYGYTDGLDPINGRNPDNHELHCPECDNVIDDEDIP
jgi:phage FluMu protein Com